MRQPGLENWHREVFYPWVLVAAGTFVLALQTIFLLRNLDTYRQYPEQSLGVVTGLLSIPLIALVGAAFMLPWTVGRYSRTFDMDVPLAECHIEDVMRRAGMSFREGRSSARRLFFIWRPDAIFDLDHLDLTIQLFGTQVPRKWWGSITRVYVGRFDGRTRKELWRVLKLIDAIENLDTEPGPPEHEILARKH